MWSPYLMLLLIGVYVVYLLITGPWKHVVGGTEQTSLGKKTLFGLGLLLLYTALGSPLDLMAHISFSAHMLSMAVAYIAAPPLLLLGIPNWLYQRILKIRGISRLSFLMRPIFATILFNGLFSLYHLPVVHDYVMTNYFVHTVYYFVLLVTALMMWWPIVNPLPDTHSLTDLRKLAYVFINGVLLTPACAMIIFADQAMYATYTNAELWAIAMGYCVPAGSEAILANFGGPEFFMSYEPRADQQLGGVIMKLSQEFIYGIILLYIFINWYRKENKEEPIEESWSNGNLNRA
ncbi:cytochrome c oxidase assembly factor CtaG [Xylanibacillus composti]|nr:cytochrome c oxidase assembly factor CtaG [Xylanibacillus composti]